MTNRVPIPYVKSPTALDIDMRSARRGPRDVHPLTRVTRHRTLGARALSNTIGFATSALAVVLLFALAGCRPSDETSAQTSAERAAADKRIAELVEVLMPIDRTVTSDVQDVRFIRGQKMVEELSHAGPEVGRAALRALGHQKEEVVAVERGLLTVGARAATEDARPLLETLVTQFGASIELRTEAMLRLAEVAPERALELLEPMILGKKRNQTLPPAEFIVMAWVTACDKTGRSPVKELADVATNLFQDETARIRATKELGRYKDPRGEAALREILVESTGDGYMRRMAVQSLHATLPAETACAIFELVASKEADINFAHFLADALDKWCGR